MKPRGDSVLVIGATSGIARALAMQLAQRGAALMLVARDQEELEAIAADLRVRTGVAVQTALFDALDRARHDEQVQAWCSALGGAPDGVVVCYGYLPDPEASRTDGAEAARSIDVNLTSVVTLLSALSARMRHRGRGWIMGISSVAGDRGRQSNYAYGAAKAGLNAYLQGLRNDLWHHGVHVITVKPGFVDTPMLRGTDAADSPLVASPERVARRALRGLDRGRNTVYAPALWAWIMLVIRWIPEAVFKRLKL